MMKKVTLDTIRSLARDVKGDIKDIYLHWTAGRYTQFFDDYHINIDGDGNIYISTYDLGKYKPHTWHRNSNAVGICICCAYNANAKYGFNADFGDYPPTEKQIDAMAQVVAALCFEWNMPITSTHVKTHCEAAEEDGYGPSTTCERWDLWYLKDFPNNNMAPGGDVIRGKALWWQKKLGW